MKLTILLAALILFAGLNPSPVLAASGAFYDTDQTPCLDCHLCPAPTKESPCLKGCAQATSAHTVSTRADQGPDMIILGEPGNLYEQVEFDHRAHAEMGSMGDGCVSCHHYTPTGHVPPCSECHLKPAKLGQPGLKGAYHRQCLGCHKEWSGSNECSNCHIANETNATISAVSPRDRGQLIQASAFKPEKKVYEIAGQNGDKVTFYHNDHVEKFGVDCVTCHQRETCAYCHDPGSDSVPIKSAEEIHTICNDCHDGDNCNLCHGKKEKSPFTHDASHWRLGEYHRHLPCTECHDDWGPDNFNHQVTGLKLDETHSELDCTDCHSRERYHQPPTCIDCHDEDRTPKATPPGYIISGMFSNGTNSKEVN